MNMTPKEIIDHLWREMCINSKHPSVWEEWVNAGLVPNVDYKTDKITYKKVIKSLQKAEKIPKKCKKPSKMDTLPAPRDDESPEEYAKEVAIELGETPTLTEARTYQTIYQGKLSQLKYEIEKGRLVDKSDVEQAAFAKARQVRDHLLAIPERVAGELASITEPVEMRERLYQELISALEILANESV